MRILLLALSTSAVAHAETIPDPEQEIAMRTVPAREKPTPMKLGVAVNFPVSWLNRAFGASAYWAPTKRQVIRANVARYKYPGNDALGLVLMEELEGFYRGAITDVGASYALYPRRAFDGPVLEAGLLVRHTNGTHEELAHDERKKTNYVAGRALVGWSWLFYQRVFFAMQVGLSAGRELGATTVNGMERASERWLQPEYNARIGVVWDL